MNIMQQPYFLNNGGNKKMKDGIMLWYADKNSFISSIKCTGAITIHSTYNGIATTETYSNLNNTAIYINADPYTEVYIQGNVNRMTCGMSEVTIKCHNTELTYISCFNNNTLVELDIIDNTVLSEIYCNLCNKLSIMHIYNNSKLSVFDCSKLVHITEIDLSTNKALSRINCSYCNTLRQITLPNGNALSSIDCSYCTELRFLDLSKNPKLNDLYCYACPFENVDLSVQKVLQILGISYCSHLVQLNLSQNEALNYLYFAECYKLSTIYAIAQSPSIANTIAKAINSVYPTNGTLYINSSDTYASTVISAATAKGWTVKDLPAA